MKLSRMAMSIQPSLTRELFDKAKEYDNVIDFTLGDPDYATPKSIQEAGCRAIMNGYTKYSANAGIPELRKTIADYIFMETGVDYSYENEIMVTAGAMEALYLSLCCLVDEGDEVIIPAPYWINYEHMVLMCKGTPVIVDCNEKKDFDIEIDHIKKAVTDKTVAIVLNSPNNPTGRVLDKEKLGELCKLAEEKDFMILWDECYKDIIYDETEFVSILDIKDMKERAVVINSCSKRFSMTGWRIGYAAAPAELVVNMAKLQENIAACAALPSQYAAIEAFEKVHDEVQFMKQGFENRRNILVEGINNIDLLHCNYSQGTFYALVDIKETKLDSITFANQLLETKQVAVVPGITYGKCCEGYIRMAYTMSEDKLKEGIRRIEAFIRELLEEESS